MAYGDDRPSFAQRSVAIGAIFLATLEALYFWLVSIMMVSVPNPALIVVSSIFIIVVIGNAPLIFGAARSPKHWLRVSSAVMLLAMVAVPTVFICYVMARMSS